jgi:arginine repressor
MRLLVATNEIKCDIFGSFCGEKIAFIIARKKKTGC